MSVFVHYYRVNCEHCTDFSIIFDEVSEPFLPVLGIGDVLAQPNKVVLPNRAIRSRLWNQATNFFGQVPRKSFS